MTTEPTTELTALDVICNLTLPTTMALVKDIGSAVNWDEKSRTIADLVAADLLSRFNDDFEQARHFAAQHGLTLKVTLA